MIIDVDPQWYKKIWSLDIQDMSWVEQTAREVDFVQAALELAGRVRILDLACGYGRHALELARRGHTVVGVDITAVYIAEAQRRAQADGLANVEFICADVRDVTFSNQFDAVLNMADGAIGYLEDDAENLKIFDLVSAALKPGGKHLMGVCSGDYAIKHFPRRHWEAGTQSLSLADFAWDSQTSRMLYAGHTFKYGEVLTQPEETGFPTSTRLYTREELREIFHCRGMVIRQAYGDYDLAVPASADHLMLVVCSQKITRA
ncbi:MAG: class I SAM-dependent methyltransferase [Anaerolineae bacterium]|nr:class I SAM-dependent methyltransferase [Anaerolineae bacterium]